MSDLYAEVVSFARTAANEVDDLEWGFDLDHTGTSTKNIAVYICPSSERRNPSQDLTDDSWDIEGPYIMSRGNYAACWARESISTRPIPTARPPRRPWTGCSA